MKSIPEATLNRIKLAVKGSPSNEALARTTLDNILVFCIAEEKEYAEHQATADPSEVMPESGRVLEPGVSTLLVP